MNKLNKLPAKKTLARYSYRESFSGCPTTSDTDTTSPLTLTTTHIWKK